MGKQITLSQDEFDLVWELLVATAAAINRGELNAHRGMFGQGVSDPQSTEDLRKRTYAITARMADLVAGDDRPIVLEIGADE